MPSIRHALPALALPLLAALPAAASADTMTMRPGADVVEDKTFPLIVEGTHERTGSIFSSYLYVKAKLPSSDPACGSTYFNDTGSSIVSSLVVPVGPYRHNVQISPAQTGPLLVCGWIMSTVTTQGAGQATVNVRAPRHSLRISAPKRPRGGQRATIRLRGNAEVSRRLIGRLISTRARCGQSAESQRGVKLFTSVRGVNGRISLDTRTPRLKRGRTYTACVYLQEEADDSRAEKVARKTFRVR